MQIKKLTLKQARQLADLTQEQAAERIGVTKYTILKWEKGRSFPNAEQIGLIEKVYGLPYSMIMFLERRKNEKT